MRRPPSFAGIAPPLGSASALRSARSSTRSSHATRRQKSPRLLRLRCASPWARTPLRVVLLLLDFVTTRGDDHNKNSLPPVRWSGHSFTCSISISVHVVFGARAPVAVAPTAHGRAGGRDLIHRGGDQEIHPPQTRRSRLEIKGETPKTIQLLSNKLLIHVSAMITYYAVGVDGMLRAI